MFVCVLPCLCGCVCERETENVYENNLTKGMTWNDKSMKQYVM